MDVNEALSRDDVPDLTKSLITSALNSELGMPRAEYASEKNKPNSLYCF